MLEKEMFPIVKKWLLSGGFEVYAEVPSHGRDIDVVGDRNGSQQVCIEMKRSFTKSLKQQLSYCKFRTPTVYSCTLTMPSKSNQEWCKIRGIGILVIKDSREIEVILSPVDKQPGKKYKWLNLMNAPKDNIGGAASGKDKHPAVDTYNRIVDFLKQNPGASWDLVFQYVPNHYKHARSMMQSMRLHCKCYELEPLKCTGSGTGTGGRKRKPRFKRF